MQTTLRPTLLLAAATILSATVACSHRESKQAPDSVAIADSASAAVANAGNVAQRAMQRAGVTQNVSMDDPDAVVIHTTDNAVTLALANDTVSMGLSDSTLNKARADMARDTADKGMGGALSKLIQKTVNSALHSRIAYPVQDLESAKYENGAIVFTYRVKRKVTFDNVSSDHHKALQSFAPADAQRFVAAVDSAIADARGQ